MDLTDADVTDILALLDTLPYDELDLETSRFRLTLRRTPHGWTQSTRILSAPALLEKDVGTGRDGGRAGGTGVTGEGLGGAVEAGGEAAEAGGEADGAGREADGTGGEADGAGGELVAVRAPLPGTFYRAPRPGAAPFVDVGSQVSADTVIGIVETMKLMNSVHAGVAGTVAEFCVQNAEFAAHGAILLRIRADQ
jgi:acetyl-CoA carboxylase biotin carboxyl carrier protein